MQTRPCPLCGNESARLVFLEEHFRIVRCRACSLVYLENPPEEGSLYEEYYSAQEPAISDYALDSSDPALTEMFAINQQRVTLIASAGVTGRLLDIGCGRGFFLRSAQSGGYAGEGIDVSERAVAFAARVAGVRASTSTLDMLIQRQERFGIITAWHVLEHILHPLEELRKVKMLLDDGGRLFVEVPNLHSARFMVARTKWRGGDHPRYHRTFFTAATLRTMLMRAGFATVERIPLTYRLPQRNHLYESGKRVLNSMALDAFLCFRARS